MRLIVSTCLKRYRPPPTRFVLVLSLYYRCISCLRLCDRSTASSRNLLVISPCKKRRNFIFRSVRKLELLAWPVHAVYRTSGPSALSCSIAGDLPCQGSRCPCNQGLLSYVTRGTSGNSMQSTQDTQLINGSIDIIPRAYINDRYNHFHVHGTVTLSCLFSAAATIPWWCGSNPFHRPRRFSLAHLPEQLLTLELRQPAFRKGAPLSSIGFGCRTRDPKEG